MSVKKLLILAAAGVASALAGGASNYSAPAASMSSEDQVGLYVGVNGGWDQLGWKNQVGTATGSSWNNAASEGSFTLGADVGYSFNQYLAVELGGFWLPTEAKYTAASPANNLTLKTWDLYLAGKGTVDLMDDVNLFGKLGVAYTHTDVSGTPTTISVATGDQGTWRPLFAAGLGYDFAQDWNVNAQYALILGRQSNGKTYSPNQNIYTLGVAYTFAM